MVRRKEGSGMTLPLNRDTLAAAYDYLVTTPPFSRWNMPESEEIRFVVDRHPGRCGGYRRENGRHVILISSRCVGFSDTLIRCMAHEMVHLHQGDVKMETGAEHNRAFWKLAERVCKVHGFDERLF